MWIYETIIWLSGPVATTFCATSEDTVFIHHFDTVCWTTRMTKPAPLLSHKGFLLGRGIRSYRKYIHHHHQNNHRNFQRGLKIEQEAFEKCWAHSRLRAASRPLTRCRYRYCRAPPAHRCPRRQRQRQRVTEWTAMAPWNGPNKWATVEVNQTESNMCWTGGLQRWWW